MPYRDVQAVILGGGKGTRLYPLTKMRTKPAVPIGGNHRLIDITMSNCINSGINRVFILTQFLPASLHRHVHRTYQFDVFSGGSVEILPAELTPNGGGWYKGTADAVRRQMVRILSRTPQDLLILAGDHLYRMNYGQFLDEHRECGAGISIAAVPVTAEEAPRYGILKATDGGRVVAFAEKPQDPALLEQMVSRPGDERPYLASMGIYVFRTDVAMDLLREGNGDDFGKEILPAAIDSRHVHAYLFDGYWRDIGTIDAYYEANLALTHPDPPFDFYDPSFPIYTRSRFLPSSRIDRCRIEQTVVADGCRLYEADIEECVIGLRSIVRPGVQLRHAVMMGAGFYQTEQDREQDRQLGRPHVGVGEGANIERAIIDKNARIGQGVTIRSHEGEADHDDNGYAIRDGVVVIAKNTLIPDGTVI